MKTAVAGYVGQQLSKPSTESSEAVGLTAAVIILLFAFGTVTAMALPILTAVLGLACALSIIQLLSHVFDVPTVAPTLGTMIGLGVGIDYALFIVTRHKLQLKQGMEMRGVDRPCHRHGGRSGVLRRRHGDHRAVLARGGGHPAGHEHGLRGRRGGRRGRAGGDHAAAGAARGSGPADRLAAREASPDPPRRPRAPRLGALGAAAWRTARGARDRGRAAHPRRARLPRAPARAGPGGRRRSPKSTTERQSYDLLAEGFGPGPNGPLLISVKLGSPAKPDQKGIDDVNKQEQQLKDSSSSRSSSRRSPRGAAAAGPAAGAAADFQQQQQLDAEEAGRVARHRPAPDDAQRRRQEDAGVASVSPIPWCKNGTAAVFTADPQDRAVQTTRPSTLVRRPARQRHSQGAPRGPT